MRRRAAALAGAVAVVLVLVAVVVPERVPVGVREREGESTAPVPRARVATGAAGRTGPAADDAGVATGPTPNAGDAGARADTGALPEPGEWWRALAERGFRIRVVDDSTGERIPGARVELTDAAGERVRALHLETGEGLVERAPLALDGIHAFADGYAGDGARGVSGHDPLRTIDMFDAPPSRATFEGEPTRAREPRRVVEAARLDRCADVTEEHESDPAHPTVITIALVPLLPVRGRVVDAATGAPLAGARVSTDQDLPSALTDARGDFEIGVSPAGWGVMVRAEAAGYAGDSGWVHPRVSTSGERPETIRLLRAGVLRVRVVDPDGKPLPGARVQAGPADRWNPRAREFRSSQVASASPSGVGGVRETDGDGIAGFATVPPGMVIVAAADSPRFAPAADARVSLASAGDRVHVELRMRRAAALRVTVEAGAGNVEGTRVWRTADGDTWYPLDAVGHIGGHTAVFRERGLAPGTYAISAEVPGRTRDRREVLLGEGATVEVALGPGLATGSLAGVLVDDAGAPVAAGNVRAFSRSPGAPAPEPVAADGAGRFAVGGLAPGPWELVARDADNIGEASLDATAPAEDLRVVIPRPGTLRLAIRAPGVTPAPTEWRLALVAPREGRPRWPEWIEPIPAREGAAVLLPVAAGRGTLRVEAAGAVPALVPYHAAPGAVADLGVVVLLPGARVRGTVRDPAGEAVAGAIVLAEGYREGVRTDDAGRFTLPALPDGPINVRVRGGDGDVSAWFERSVPGAPAGWDLVLARSATVEVCVRGPGGAPWYGVLRMRRVDPSPTEDQDGDDLTRSARTDVRGACPVRLPPGRWRISAVDDAGSALASATVDAAEGGTHAVELTVP